MKERTLLTIVNISTIAWLAIFYSMGRIARGQLLVVIPITLLVMNVAFVVGMRLRKNRGDKKP